VAQPKKRARRGMAKLYKRPTNYVFIPKCGRVESASGQPFNPITLKQHERDCPVCNPVGLRMMRFQQAKAREGE
jgi:hypothetical protein